MKSLRGWLVGRGTGRWGWGGWGGGGGRRELGRAVRRMQNDLPRLEPRSHPEKGEQRSAAAFRGGKRDRLNCTNFFRRRLHELEALSLALRHSLIREPVDSARECKRDDRNADPQEPVVEKASGKIGQHCVPFSHRPVANCVHERASSKRLRDRD